MENRVEKKVMIKGHILTYTPECKARFVNRTRQLK